MIFVTTTQVDFESSIFNRMSIPADNKSQETPIYNYSLTVSYVDETTNKFVYISNLNSATNAFSLNQDSVISIANELFANAVSMTSLEQDTLAFTIKRLSKKTSNLKGRK